MQTMIKSTVRMSLYLGIILLSSCGKDKASPMNCASNAEKVGDVATTYAQNPTKANCEAYKSAVRDFYKSCANFYTGASKQAMDEFLAEPCPN